MCPLPTGLRLCDTCGEARGPTPAGSVSACYCSGEECLWCGGIIRRPITDYYDRRDRKWWHASYVGAITHRCAAPIERRVGRQWQARIPDADVASYQEATTALAWAMVEDRERAREGN